MGIRQAVVAGLIALVVTPLVTAAGAGATTSQTAAFDRYVAEVKGDLASCTSRVLTAQTQLDDVLGSDGSVTAALAKSASASVVAAKKDCGSQDKGVHALASLRVPSGISFIASLHGTATQARNWATVDTARVLRDFQQLLAPNASSYTAGAAIDTDSQVGDFDAGTLRAAFSHAAQRLHASFAGLGLVLWTP